MFLLHILHGGLRGTISALIVLPVNCFEACMTSKERTASDEAALQVEEGYFQGADGVQLFYRKVGSGGDTAVYLHGGPWNMSDGGYELDELARDRTLIAFDQRSGGRSELVNDTALLSVDYYIRDLEALREHFGIGRMIVIGQSWGTGLAVQYASRYPGRVSRMLLLSPMPPAHTPYWPQRIEKTESVIGPEGVARIAKIGEMIPTASDSQVVELCREQFILMFRAYLTDVSALDRMKVGYCDASPEAIRHQYMASTFSFASFGDWDFHTDLAKLHIPVLVVEGTETHIPLDATREWAAALPNARLLLVPGASHIVWLEGNLEYFFTGAEQFLSGEWPGDAETVSR